VAVKRRKKVDSCAHGAIEADGPLPQSAPATLWGGEGTGGGGVSAGWIQDDRCHVARKDFPNAGDRAIRQLRVIADEKNAQEEGKVVPAVVLS